MKETFKKGDVLTIDTSRLSKEKRDLTAFAELLNEILDKLIKGGYIEENDITNELIASLSLFDISSVVDMTNKRFAKELEAVRYTPMRQQLMAHCKKAIEEITSLMLDARRVYDNTRLSAGFILDLSSRCDYLLFASGHIVFDEDKLTERHTKKIESEAQAELINKIAVFVDELRAMNDYVLGIQKSRHKVKLLAHGEDSVITIDENGVPSWDREIVSLLDM